MIHRYSLAFEMNRLHFFKQFLFSPGKTKFKLQRCHFDISSQLVFISSQLVFSRHDLLQVANKLQDSMWLTFELCRIRGKCRLTEVFIAIISLPAFCFPGQSHELVIRTHNFTFLSELYVYTKMYSTSCCSDQHRQKLEKIKIKHTHLRH